MADDGRVRRALLFMPGDDRRKIEKGAGLDVDTVIMDLEDGVALNNKEAARKAVLAALTDPELDFGRTERLVRINPPGVGLMEADIAATAVGRPDGYVIPKVEEPLAVQQVAQLVLDRERRHGITAGTIRLLAIIETARGVVNLKEIARASERLVALMFGAEDLAGSMGAVRTAEGHEGFYARSAVVLHAAASGLQAIDTPHVDLTDEDGLRAQTERAMQMGYVGKMAIHPKQVAPIVAVFTPSEEEVAQAQELIAAFKAHQESGTGVFAYKGQMVDMPMVRAAQRVLARAEAANEA